MGKLGYTWYPKDWTGSDAVFELNLEQRGFYRELIDIAMLSDNKIIIKQKTWQRRWDISKEKLEELLKVLSNGEDPLITIDNYKLFIPSCEPRLHFARAGKLGGEKSKLPDNYDNISDKHDRRGFLYFCYDNTKDNEFMKFGVSVSPEKRIYQIKRQHNRPNMELIKIWEVSSMKDAEWKVYNLFSEVREGECINKKMNVNIVETDIKKVIKNFLIKPFIKPFIKQRERERERESKRERETKREIKIIIGELEVFKKEIFKKWMNYRQEIKKPINVLSTLKILIKRFNSEDLPKIEWVVDYSIENKYTGLIWEKAPKNITKKSNKVSEKLKQYG